MSWEAVTWANRQKLKKSYEQIVLLVLANCADPNGECFVKWPGRDHWWVYLSEKTRLPKSSLFRHLNTVMALGLGARSEIVMADGSRRPTFKLDLAASFDIESPEDEQRYNAATSKGSSESQSPRETETEDDGGRVENHSDINHAETSDESQSPPGTEKSPTESPSGTGPFPVLGMHKDSKSVPKDSPQPPSGGTTAPVDQGWDEFCTVWREPMPRHDLARSAWEHLATDKHPTATAAARGYVAWREAQRKPPTPISAQTFLRDETGWAQWLRFVPSADGTVPVVSLGCFEAASLEAKAISALYEIAGRGEFFRQVKCRGGKVYFSDPLTLRLLALAAVPPRDEWVRVDRQQAAAWEGLLGEHLQIVRPRLAEGASAPWPWPPRKDGTLSPTGPPGPTAEDLDALANEGQK